MYKLITLVIACGITGCTIVPTMQSKSVAVTKDAEGRILSITETETLAQQGVSRPPIIMHYFKVVEDADSEDFDY